MFPLKFRFEDSILTVSEINSSNICKQARYVFDKPIILRPDDTFLLDAGQWFLVRDIHTTLIEGMWKSNQ